MIEKEISILLEKSSFKEIIGHSKNRYSESNKILIRH